MPFFVIVPVWMLCVVLGLGFCLFQRLRFMSPYLILGSTGGLVLSFALSMAAIVLVPKIFSNESWWVGIVLVGGYFASIVLGGLAGVALGFIAARRVNQRLRWTAP